MATAKPRREATGPVDTNLSQSNPDPNQCIPKEGSSVVLVVVLEQVIHLTTTTSNPPETLGAGVRWLVVEPFSCLCLMAPPSTDDHQLYPGRRNTILREEIHRKDRSRYYCTPYCTVLSTDILLCAYVVHSAYRCDGHHKILCRQRLIATRLLQYGSKTMRYDTTV